MKYRKDINGLRAIAVIAVVIFHFSPDTLRGGFAGVDVFFVISGFLMTGIIFDGLEQGNFSNVKFYIARANRIIPALAFLCFALLLIGFFTFTPHEFRELGKHIVGSIGFISNIIYWSESGYFDSSSHEKWLLHTWSLSVEWQFYVIYPLVLSFLKRFFLLHTIRRLILIATGVSFLISLYYTYYQPTAAYYLLTSRMWEMLLGGIAFLYHFNLLKKYNKQTEVIGLSLIVTSYLFVSSTSPWPGILALMPVLGTFMILQSNNNSWVTNNVVFQKLGAWSYSIYLWHWPIVVFIHVYSLNNSWIFLGMTLSILLGYLSFTFIEQRKFRRLYSLLEILFKCKPVLFVYFIGIIAVVIYKTDGNLALSAEDLAVVTQNITESPKRNQCHSKSFKYILPELSCSYFNETAHTAIFGDSHGVEIAYALAHDLKRKGMGVRHFTFSGCQPAYKQKSDTDKCVIWTNETVNYIIKDNTIKNVVITYRLTAALFGHHLDSYPNLPTVDSSRDEYRGSVLYSLTETIKLFSKHKKNVVIILPIPELPKDINALIRESYRSSQDVYNIRGSNLRYYFNRHAYVLDYFNKHRFPDNVKFIDPSAIICDNSDCWAIKDKIPLYFDDNHLSVAGASFISKELTRILNYPKYN